MGNKKVKDPVTRIGHTPYSTFRRSIYTGGASLDVDNVEVRDGKIKAVMAITGRLESEAHIMNSKRMIWERSTQERFILIDIARALACKAFYVIHDVNLELFHVHNILNPLGLDQHEKMNRAQYEEFLRGL